MADDSINFQFTAKGQQLASQALAGTVKLDFTKAVASTDNHFSDSAATIAALTTLANVKQTATISEVDRVAEDDTEVRIPVTFDKSQVGDDYQLLTVGLYCKPDNGAEVLYAVAGLANPILMHKSLTSSVYSIDMYVIVGTSSNVTIKVNPAGAVTHADLTTILCDYAKTADMTKSLADYTKTTDLNTKLADYEKSADISKSLGDYAKTVDVNQQLDKKVNIADMRKPASDVAGLEDVSTALNQNNLADGTDLNTVTIEGVYPFVGVALVNAPKTIKHWGCVKVTFKGSMYLQELFTDDDLRYFRFAATNLNWSPWATIADDSKVAHLSGTNNFDTVPTVNNNPLLLASSLPSDLARTGQDANFTGKLQRNGKDVATTDDLTIVYAGVPSLSFDNNGNYTITASKNADIAHITDYTLYYRVKGNGDFTQVALTPDKLTGTIDLSKVTTATNYEAYATATNVFGESDPSSMVQWSYDPAKASSTPPNLEIADDGTYTITAPATTPTPIVKYFLYYNVDGQSDTVKLNVGTNLTGNLKELIAKPDKTTTYDIQAAAMNANAESGVSNSLQFTYVPIDDSIYGASWDRKSSPTLTRTDAAVGLQAGINGAQNDFDNVEPWKGMHRVTDSMNNVFVRVPKFYIRKTQTGDPDNGTATWQVSLVSHGDDWYLPKGFWDFENSKELDYIDIGAYDATGSSSKLTSVAGKTPLVNLSIADFRSAAQANGTGYQIWDIHAWDMLQVLFIIEFATLNSQSIMEGIDNGSSAANSGAADSHKGSSGTAGSGSNAMSYRGIENLYDNVLQFCDGVNFKDNQPWICEDATKYQSDLFAAPYVRTGYAATSSGSNYYIKALGFDSVHPYAQFTTDDSGSGPTYYADYDYPGSGNTILETGGYWGDGADVGLFYSARDFSSTYAGAVNGCRLLKKALP